MLTRAIYPVTMKYSVRHWPLYPFISYGLLLLTLLSFSRLLLTGWQFERVGSLEHALKIMAYGLRFDLIVICMLWFVPAILLLFTPRNRLLFSLQTGVSKLWLMLTTMLFVFLEISTPAFIDQYDTRPNRIFFEYLETPVEVLKTSLYEYPFHFVVAIVLLVLLWRFLSGFNCRVFQSLQPWPLWVRILVLPVLLLVLALGARSSLDHRPANASTAAFSNDQLVNKLGLSSIYTVLTAVYNLKNEDSAGTMYGEMPAQDIVRIVRQNMQQPVASFSTDLTSTWHRQSAAPGAKPFNLVILLEESLGAGFVGKLGGVGVTPELDKLADEGLWFSDLYATGTRSARGIEAVITGFPPSPSRSVLKLGLAQQHFATLASLLKQQQYDTQFIYGGESHFDNMAGFFLANGFDRVTDQNDYTNPKFRATWGVSDEDLFQRVDDELMGASARPQFILAFTSSNHSPFEFPDNTISLHDADKHTVNNAVKYADYALGEFFKKARNQPYWDNTIFLIVADHDTRVFGASLVPIDRFHIPGLIIGPGIKPTVYSKVASQIDLAPTLLHFMGISVDHPMPGHVLTELPVDYRGRALMQYGNNHAYMEGSEVVIHVPEKPAKQFQYKNKVLIEQPSNAEFIQKAQAHALWPMYAYQNRKYLHQ